MEPGTLQQSLDNLWVTRCACLVFFMNAGFALASVVYYLAGFGIMFGDGNGLLGLNGFALAADRYIGTMPTHLAPFVLSLGTL